MRPAPHVLRMRKDLSGTIPEPDWPGGVRIKTIEKKDAKEAHAVLAAGWPGERVRDSTGANRVHVALSTLRNLGLRPFLVSGPDGYALTSARACVLEPGE